MEQQPVPIPELLELVLFLGSTAFMLGAIYQMFILRRNKKSRIHIFLVAVLTRTLTIPLTLLVWPMWNSSFDTMFLFLFLPALLPEMILSPLILKISGNNLWRRKPFHSIS